MVTVKIQRLNSQAKIPTYGSQQAAGFDLASAETDSFRIAPGQTAIVKTGLSVELPEGYELQIRSRSGLAAKHGVFVTNGPGTIDADYRGEIGVILTNSGPGFFKVNPGDRIAQGVVMPVPRVEFVEVASLSDSVRGSGGFGHTGIN